MGTGAGDAITSGSNLIAIGCGALSAEDTNTNGSIAIGQDALAVQNTTGLGNVAIGKNAGQSVTTGGESVYIGYSAGGGTTGSKNTIIGFLALTASGSGEENVVIGRDAGRNTTGSQNTIVGDAAGDASGDGSYNVFLGKNSGSAVTNGDGNTFLGYNSGDAVTTGCYNVALGHNVDVASATGNTQLAIGCAASNWITGDSSFHIQPGAGIRDTAGNLGSAGQVLCTTGSAVAWADAGGGATSGSFTATPGSASTLDTYAYDSAELVFEYTVFVKNGSDYQSQKILIMRDSTTVHSTEYAVMYSSSLLVSLDVTISGSNLLLRATPEPGVSGSTTFRFKREAT